MYVRGYVHAYGFSFSICLWMYISLYMAAPQKHWDCNRPGRPFCDRGGGSCDKPSLQQAYRRLQYSTQRPATRVCNRGPGIKVYNRGGGLRQTLIALHRIHIILYCRHADKCSHLCSLLVLGLSPQSRVWQERLQVGDEEIQSILHPHGARDPEKELKATGSGGPASGQNLRRRAAATC